MHAAATRHRRAGWWVAVAVLAAMPSSTSAQRNVAAPPGPYVIDVRGALMGLPQDTGFYPQLPDDALVPARGFGLEAGAHLYFGRFGPGQLGIGASVSQVRGTAPAGTELTMRMIAPQVSINFGTRDGWSFLSGGVGVANARGEFSGNDVVEAGSRSSDTMLAINGGGGARWFMTSHLAVGFDMRLHWIAGQSAKVALAGTPSDFLFMASAGLSIR
ncbi:MAG TPA: outer membrane beta-barrel protein [Vicinamibacterales bacterium]|nr:outer membrane beta-barrel protein [Vicinamibacterales bacterium]